MTLSWAMHLRALYLVALLFVRLDLSRGILVNRTIDDQFGDSVTGVLPAYEGTSWKQGATCTECLAQPDTSLAFQGTWHDATWSPGDPSEDIMSVSFTGTAVYVFIILANTVPLTTTLTSLSFTLDGEQVGNFVHAPTTSTDYEYNVTAYSNDSLANAQHTLVMQTAGDNTTLVLFDYVIYSVDDEVTTSSPPSSSSPSPTSSPSPSLSSSPTDPTSTGGNGKDTKTIVGASVGGAVAVALIIGLLLCWFRRRRNSVSVPQISSSMNGGISLNDRPESLYWGEATTGAWLTSSVPTGTYATVPSHYNLSSAVPSTTIVPWDPNSHVAEYIQPTAEAQLGEGVTSIQSPKSEAYNKSVGRQRDLFQRAEQMGLGAIPTTLPDRDLGREVRDGSKPHGGAGEAGALREQVVFLLDEVERLHVQNGLNGSDSEPPPDYSTEGRRSPLLRL